MARYVCDTCGGDYTDPQPDGLRYFHACPPLARVRVRRPGRGELLVEPGDVGPLDEPIAEVYVDQVGARDENVVAEGRDRGKPRAGGTDRHELEA